jgi:hypothetical protein
LPNGIYVFYPWRTNVGVFFGLWSLKNNIFEVIPIGEHIIYSLSTYGRNDKFRIETIEFNDGTKHFVCNFLGNMVGGWAKK